MELEDESDMFVAESRHFLVIQNKKELSELLLQLRKEYGQTILLVTHDKELAQMADRVIEIVDGVIK